jgi:hypothetical protein
MNFSDFYWHDAIIENIQINRLNPGNEDTIKFEIVWPENIGRVTFVFEEVYWAMMNLNFGIISHETIQSAYILEDNNQDLVNFYSKWNGAMNDVKLNTYKIELNSTGGEIKIIAKRFSVYKIPTS